MPPPRPAWAHDPTSLADTVVTTLVISMGFNALQFIITAAWAVMETTTEVTETTRGIIGGIEGILALPMLLWTILGTVFALRWIYFANLNSLAFGAHTLSHSAAWAVGSWFVPFANLFVPYRALREIWQVSLDPANWRRQRVPPLLGWWWAMWVTHSILGNVSLRLVFHEWKATEPSTLMFGIDLAIAALGLPVDAIAALIVTRITAQQRRLVE